MKKTKILSELQEAQQEHEYWERKLAAMMYSAKLLDSDIKVAEKQVRRWREKIEKLEGKT